MAKSYNNEAESNGINLIGNGTNIKGDINSNSDLRIDGSLEGNITTAGKIVVGESGQVKGEIKCKNGDISGNIEGKIIAEELLSLKASSTVEGDIIINKLAVEPGCHFVGNCKMEKQHITNVDFKKSQKQESEERKTKAV